MKICIVCTRFNLKRLGGVERVILNLSKKIISKGHDVTIICKQEWDECLYEKHAGIKIKRVKCVKSPGLKTSTAFFSLRKKILNEKADIYNPHDWSSGFLFLFGKMNKLKYILTSHGFLADYESPPLLAKMVEKFVFSKTKAEIVCVQRFSKNTNYLNDYNMEYIPNGVHTNLFSIDKSSKDGEYVLFVASIDERKNIARVCKAFSENGLPIRIVGDGPLRKMLSQKYKKDRNIKFLGRREGLGLIKLFQKCKFFVLPSTAEGFGLVWIEAQSCGKPIVASNVGVGPELIIDKDFGRLINNTSSQTDISRNIISLNKQIDQDGTKSEKIRKNIINNYSWDSISDKYLNKFEVLLSK
ncbi:glycosyltransferase family 4 protein [archaeon]|jgi:glycosyltransferase involved in cell wall biosynthesis|nr:glycosyltransferase family 4 protein [archaeon]MBT7128946.1 glycosyltransferase family 4 protein [archaeon]